MAAKKLVKKLTVLESRLNCFSEFSIKAETDLALASQIAPRLKNIEEILTNYNSFYKELILLNDENDE